MSEIIIDTPSKIYVFGYPKVGTTWMCRLLGDVLNSSVGGAFLSSTEDAVATEGSQRTGSYYIGQGHQVPFESISRPEFVMSNDALNSGKWDGEGVIIMCRDPRAVVASAYHYWQLPSLEESADCILSGKWPVPQGGGMNNWYEHWFLKCRFPATWVRYEDLHHDTAGVIQRVLSRMSIVKSTKVISDAVRRQSIDMRRKWTAIHGDSLVYGKEYQLRFLREGSAHGWRRQINTALSRRIAEGLGDYMELLEYDL